MKLYNNIYVLVYISDELTTFDVTAVRVVVDAASVSNTSYTRLTPVMRELRYEKCINSVRLRFMGETLRRVDIIGCSCEQKMVFDLL